MLIIKIKEKLGKYSIISWFHSRIDYKGEPVIKSITDFANEFQDLLSKVLFVDPMHERFSR